MNSIAMLGIYSNTERMSDFMNNNFNNNQQNFVPPQQTVYNSLQNLMPRVAPQYVSAKPKKVYSPLDKKDKRFLPLFVISAFILADFLVGSMLSYSLELTVFCFVQFIFSTFYLYDKSRKPSLFVIACGGLSLVGSVTFTLFSDGLINFLMLVLVGGLYGLYCLGLSGKFTADTGSYRIMLDLIFDTFVRPFKSFSCLIGALKAGDKKEKKNLSALFGILLAVPVLLVVVPLLIKSDAAFEGVVRNLTRNIGDFVFEVVAHIDTVELEQGVHAAATLARTTIATACAAGILNEHHGLTGINTGLTGIIEMSEHKSYDNGDDKPIPIGAQYAEAHTKDDAELHIVFLNYLWCVVFHLIHCDTRANSGSSPLLPVCLADALFRLCAEWCEPMWFVFFK